MRFPRFPVVVVACVSCLTSALAQELAATRITPNLEAQIDRPLRYRPEQGDFVIVNGAEFFNRPLYGGNTAFRVDGGDKPEWVLYLPGRGGNVRLGVTRAGDTKWLHEAAHIETRYRPGELLYEIRDPMLGANGVLRVAAIAYADTEGLGLKVEAEKLPAGTQLFWAYGGVSGQRGKRDGDIGTESVPISEWFQLKPEFCRGNAVEIRTADLPTVGSAKVGGVAEFVLRAKAATLVGRVSVAGRIGVADASRWNNPAAIVAGLDEPGLRAGPSASSAPLAVPVTPIVTGRLPLDGDAPVFLSIERRANAAHAGSADDLEVYREVTARQASASASVAGKPGAGSAATAGPGAATPATLEPGSATPATSGPGSATAATSGPGAATPATPDPGSATPATPDPGSTTPATSEAGGASAAELGTLAGRFAAAERHFAELRGRVSVDTPDAFLNAAVGALNVAADAVWDEPQRGIMHGAIAWRTRLLGWRGPYALDALGWHDRFRENAVYWLARQNTDPIPDRVPPPEEKFNLARNEAGLHSNGDLSNSHYDMNLVFIDALFRHLQWTGDLAFAREAWPVIERHLAWERRLFRREFGPGKLPLYEAYAAIWASDDLQYGGGGAMHASAYNYYENRQAARLARLLGKDSAPYEKEAELIAHAMRELLWVKDGGANVAGLAEPGATGAAGVGRGLRPPPLPDPAERFRVGESASPPPETAGYGPSSVGLAKEGAPALHQSPGSASPATSTHGPGWFAESKDWLGSQRVHPDAALWTFYHTLDSEMPTPPEAWWLADYVRDHIPHLPVRGPGVPEGLCTLGTSDWMPYDWSINNVVMSEAVHGALGLWQAGRSEEAWRVAKGSLLAAMYLGISPGNVGSMSYLDVYRRESQRDFADGSGVLSRAIVEGLFGVKIDRLAGELRVRPGWPATWDHAAIEHPDFSLRYQRTGDVDRYDIVQRRIGGAGLAEPGAKSPGAGVPSDVVPAGAKKREGQDPGSASSATAMSSPGPGSASPASISATTNPGSASPATTGSASPATTGSASPVTTAELPVTLITVARRDRIAEVIINGKPSPWRAVQDSIGAPRIEVEAPASAHTTIVIRWAGEPIRLERTEGATVEFRPVGQGQMRWLQPLVERRTPRADATNGSIPAMSGLERLELSSPRYEPVDLAAVFNDRVSQIFRHEYRSPRSPFVSLALPKQGIGGWAGGVSRTVAIDDSGLRAVARAAGNRLVLPNGVPLMTPSEADAPNVVFTSQWDNFPREVRADVAGSARAVYLLMAGSTNAMQSHFENGEVVVTYADGSEKRLALVNPENWWPIEQDYFVDDFQFRRPGPLPLRVDLKTGRVRVLEEGSFKGTGREVVGGAGTVLALPLDPGKPLRSLTLRATANDVVVGLLAATLVR